MNPRESDPTGSFSSGGAAGLEDEPGVDNDTGPADQALDPPEVRTGHPGVDRKSVGGGDARREDRPPHSADAGRGDTAHPRSQAESVTPDVDQAERETIVSGIGQTSEVADREAQEDAEGRGDGPPLPR